VIHVASFRRRRSAHLAQRTIDGHDVDQARACAQLHEADVERPFDRAAEHVAIERDRRLRASGSNYDVVDAA
jgi:hypothetical protein